MDLYGRPAPRRTSSPAVAFLNERPKSLSFSSGLKPPGVARGRSEDEIPHIILPDHPTGSSNQLQPQQQTQLRPPLLNQRPASSRFLNRPQSSSGVRRAESFKVSHEPKQRPRTARDGVRTLPATAPTLEKSSCFTQDTDAATGPEVDSPEGPSDSSPILDEQYVQQLKADILHLHNVHRQLEKEASENDNNGDRGSRRTAASTVQTPNHVKNLLLHRDTKAYLGWGSQRNMDLQQDLGSSSTSIQTQVLRYNYSSDPAQLAAAKIGLEALLTETLVSLMEFCLAHESCSGGTGSSGAGSGSFDENDNAFKMKLVRSPPLTRQHGDAPLLRFANGCGTSPASIYAGGMLCVLQQTEVWKRTLLACTGEKKILVKVIADKDAQLSQLTEQLGFFKDALARRRPRLERSKRVTVQDEERAPEPTDNEDAEPSTSTLTANQFARLATLEKDRVESMLSIQKLEQQKNELEQQLEKAFIESQSAFQRLEIAEQQHRESMTESKKSFQEQVDAMDKRAADLQSSLASTVERYRSLDESNAQEKSQLRRDKQELERLIRLKEDEVGHRQAQAASKAEAQAQSASTQLKAVTKQLKQAQQASDDVRLELKAAQTESKQTQGAIRSLHHDLRVRNEDVDTLTSKLAAVNTTAERKTVLLQQTEGRIEASSQEIKRLQALLEDQAQQMQLLEAKLSRSVPVDDEELQSRQQREESTWHQRVSALEHALVAERQNTALFREQQRKAVAMEQEKAAHAVEQAQAVAAELATANLCLLERKRQREQEQKAFEEKLQEYADRVAGLSSDKREIDTLRSQHEQLQRLKERSAEEAAASEKQLQEELASAKEELQNLMDIRENLDRALAHALASPRGKSVRQQATLSDLRSELHKAKLKIAALEGQRSSNDSARTSEIDGKLTQLSARERRVTEEQRGLKKQRADTTAERRLLQNERAELDQQRDAVESKQKADHTLLQQIIALLAQRLQVMMALFDTKPGNDPKDSTAAPDTDAESWRAMQQQWAALRQELQDVDWKLAEMRTQLEALRLEYAGDPTAPLDSNQPPSLPSGFHGPNPFSDAVAAGRDTVPVAEQLKASRLLRRLSCPGGSLESQARQVTAEEHETFALALAREMAAMKEGYERQLEELRGELSKTQQRRLLTSQRLRAELATERNRHQQTTTQFTEHIGELEAALEAQEKALAATQAQQQAVLGLHAAATSDAERQRALQELAELVRSEQRRRERERLSKLLTYCGASSVTVEHRDRALEAETVDAVLARLDVE
ncbi:hypothetical protein PHYPSEUDO_011133 [Phytophthora pseudosyringae]|uniref:Uncharacterized protein n=1 Tax=Phytophthora pseudosyringae TaxID=221518 RepID=A0A8T1VDX9_9STRA|nr:hypothetical protein PHYPSEUDO_011133 [Phytophthora pseudosyringae]